MLAFREPATRFRLFAFLLVASLSISPVAAQSVEQFGSTAEHRNVCEALLRAADNPAASARAQRFLELTNSRSWRYRADDGQWMTYRGAYDSESVRSDKPCLTFTTRRYVPLELLDAQATADLAEIDKLRGEIVKDYRALQAAVAARAAEAAAAEAAAAAQAATPTVVLRPMLPPDVPVVVPPGPQPPRLDCGIGSYQYRDGSSALQIESVAIGGLGYRYHLQVGEIIERVNDLPVGTLDDYRLASTRAGGALKLVLFNPRAQVSRVVNIPAPRSAVPLGVVGRIDLQGEYEIADVEDDSIADLLGLRRNDKLLRVNDRFIAGDADLEAVESVSGGEFRIRAVVDGVLKTLVYP